MSSNSPKSSHSRGSFTAFVANQKAHERGTDMRRAFVAKRDKKTGEMTAVESFIGTDSELKAIARVDVLASEEQNNKAKSSWIKRLFKN